MTAIEMPLLRQAIANAFGILLLIAVCGWLAHRAYQHCRDLFTRIDNSECTFLIVSTTSLRSKLPVTTAARKTSR
ncbi:MAG: hypothetical protein OXB98_05950 [Bryobacterales bacterium]|nr:hypothetical protein [Bryobacterales bacterium]